MIKHVRSDRLEAVDSFRLQSGRPPATVAPAHESKRDDPTDPSDPDGNGAGRDAEGR